MSSSFTVTASVRRTSNAGLVRVCLLTILDNFRSRVPQQSAVSLVSFFPIKTTMHGQKSYILQITDSDLARDYADYRKLHYPKSPIQEKIHFVVVGHDIYHEILATSFTAIAIPKLRVTDARLLSLIADE